jgi:hypothetical protein
MNGKGVLPAHWESIKDEAKPLVEQLLALNEKMGTYEIVGLKSGKKKLSKHERIDQAQEKLWGCTAASLKEGDYFWLNESGHDIEMYVGEQDPVKVDEITKKGVYFELPHCGGEHSERIDFNTKILKAPDEYRAAQEAYVGAFSDYNRDFNNDSAGAKYNELRKKADDLEKEITSEEYWLKKADELGI